MKKRVELMALSKDFWKEPRKPIQDASRVELVIQNEPIEIAPHYYRVKDLAKKFNTGIWLFYQEIKCGLLECEYVGRQPRVSEKQLQKYLVTNKSRKLR